jgi:hypothetical protein
MSEDDEPDEGAQIIAFRGSDGQPVVIPQEVARVAEQPYRCYLMHEQGMSWRNIAEIEGDGLTGRQVQAMVTRYLDEGAALITDFTRKHLMNLQLNRYERIIAVHYPKMLEGSIASAGLMMNAMREEIRLTRLDQPVLDSDDATTSQRTVVIPADTEGYSAALERAARKG